jgi:LacI family transcriptional regulator
MPSHYKNTVGIEGVLKWAKGWGTNAVIGTFENKDEVCALKNEGIAVVAQDYKKRFDNVPNLTADYLGTGRMAASYFIDRGFQNFGFFGLNDVCWSDERCEGFKKEVEGKGFGKTFFKYILQDINHFWFYEAKSLSEWLKGLPKPIGIMTCDDNQGSLLIEACRSAGIHIPSEVSIIGVDNDELICNLGTTTLSSIAVNIEEGGYQTAQMIEKMVQDPDFIPKDIVLRPIKIVERLSTAAFATDDKEIQKAVMYIHHNRHKKISVKDVVASVALSRRLLEVRFKDVTGQSIYQYIADLKIRTFAEMLVETDDQVINIALSLGENDAKSISKRFKATYGCSPNEWRSRHAKKD